MNPLIILALAACAVAAPTGPVLVEVVELRPEPVPILKQINQVNDDGSYTFGFEAGDGSFRVETRDINGHTIGKYGYIDEFGERIILDYESGKSSGKALGFLPRGSLVPIPVLRPVPSAEQRALDFQYSSVDEDEDGIPDDQVRPAVRVVAAAPKKEYQAAKPVAYKDDYAAPAPKVVVKAPIPVVPAPAPVVRVAPAPIPVPVVPAPVVRVVPAPAPVPVVQAPAPLRVVTASGPIPVPVVSAPRPVEVLRVGPQPVQVAVAQPQLFQQSVLQQGPIFRNPVAVANPTDQFFEDLANHSVDLNEDGFPDELVQGQVPVVGVPILGASE